MMKQIALAALAVVTLATATVSSHTEAKAGNGGAVIAGIIIGGAAALIAGAAHGDDAGYDRPRRDRGYDRPNRAPGRKVCEVQEQFNKWGEYVVTRKTCWIERSRY